MKEICLKDPKGISRETLEKTVREFIAQYEQSAPQAPLSQDAPQIQKAAPSPNAPQTQQSAPCPNAPQTQQSAPRPTPPHTPLKKVLILPPDYTRCYSFAGEITQIIWKELTPKGVQVDIMPALGTHMALTKEERHAFFGEEIPEEAYLVHHWQTDTIRLGTVPKAFCEEASGGLFHEEIEVEVNHLLFDGGYDLILSVGQVVPHEAVGMSNYSKNIFIGVGGSAMINKVHMMTSICGVENTMGVMDTSGRKVYDYAQEHFLDGKCPLTYIMTVVVQQENDDLSLRGLFMGSSRKPFENACALSQEVNITHVDRRAKKVVAYLEPKELRSTWVGNKGIYRTRMMIADGGELILLAPGIASFGENDVIETFIRKYGYITTEEVLKLYNEGEFTDSIMGASHIIISSPDGRFTVTYATRPELLSKEDIESVHYKWADYEETAARYDPEKLLDGWNTLPDGEEIYFVRTPALGLWKA